jgi:type IV fimbrial biogenesis protein FimT
MLSAPQWMQRGFTLVEALVAISILGVLLALGAPTFGQWLASVRVRTTAEATLAGLQYARSEATSRNQQVRFQLTSSLDASCVRSTSGASWVVDLVETVGVDSVEGQCEATPGEVNPPPPGILSKRDARDGSGNTQVAASDAALVFNGLGRVTPIPAGRITIDITGVNPAECREVGGEVTCLRLVIEPAGQIKMCNPAVASTDPQGCPA